MKLEELKDLGIEDTNQCFAGSHIFKAIKEDILFLFNHKVEGDDIEYEVDYFDKDKFNRFLDSKTKEGMKKISGSDS